MPGTPGAALRNRIDSHRFLTLAFVVLTALSLSACANLPARPTHRPIEMPAAAPQDNVFEVENWARLSREGRLAMNSGRPREAAAAFNAALETLENPSQHDARVQTTLRNLVQVASIYQRLDNSDAAVRLMSYVNTYATLQGREWLEADALVAQYEALAGHPLDHRYRPRDLDPYDRRDFEPTVEALIRRTARKYQVDPNLVKAVVAAESNFDTLAVSKKGAQGLMQLMPQTAREMGVRSPFKPSENIRGGVRYLRGLIDRYPLLDHAIAAYNAGPVAVDRFGGIPPYPETEAYVARVMRFYREYRDEALD